MTEPHNLEPLSRAHTDLEYREKITREFIASRRTDADRDMQWYIGHLITSFFPKDEYQKLEDIYKTGFSISDNLGDKERNYFLKYLIQYNAVGCLDVYMSYEKEENKDKKLFFFKEQPVIIYAATYAKPDMLQKLLDLGHDLNALNKDGHNALSWCMARAESTDNLEFLLQKGLRPIITGQERPYTNIFLQGLDGGLDPTEILLPYVNDIDILDFCHKELLDAVGDGENYKKAADLVGKKLDILKTQKLLEDNIPNSIVDNNNFQDTRTKNAQKNKI